MIKIRMRLDEFLTIVHHSYRNENVKEILDRYNLTWDDVIQLRQSISSGKLKYKLKVINDGEGYGYQ